MVDEKSAELSSALRGSIQLLTTPPPDTKERPFKCHKCRSTFVRRDLLLRHDRTVHAKDGGVPLTSEVKRRANNKANDEVAVPGPSKAVMAHESATTLEQIEASSEEMVDLEAAAMLMTDFRQKAMASQEPEMTTETSTAVISPTGPPMMESTVN